MKRGAAVAACVVAVVALALVFVVGADPTPVPGDDDSRRGDAAPVPAAADSDTADGIPPLGGEGALQVLQRQYLELQGVVGASPVVRGTTLRAAVQLRIADGYHVNANPPSEDWIIPTEVSLPDPGGLDVVRVVYPPAQDVEFDFWAEPLRVYEGTVAAGLEIRVGDDAALGDRDLEISVRYQACNDEACFAPTTATLTLPVVIAAAGTGSRSVQSPLLDAVDFASSDATSR